MHYICYSVGQQQVEDHSRTQGVACATTQGLCASQAGGRWQMRDLGGWQGSQSQEEPQQVTQDLL